MKFLILISIICSLTAFSKEPPELPANLVQVKSGAYWNEGKKEGFVRFSLFQKGFEHVRHQVVIEWIESPSSPNAELTVISRVVVKDIPDVWSVGEAVFSKIKEKNFISFGATNTYLLDKNIRYSIELTAVGKIKITSKEP